MFTVIDHYKLSRPLEGSVVDGFQNDLLPAAVRLEGFLACHLIRVSDDHFVSVAVFADSDAAARAVNEVGSPWAHQHIAPYLAAAPDCTMGEVVASTEWVAPVNR